MWNKINPGSYASIRTENLVNITVLFHWEAQAKVLKYYSLTETNTETHNEHKYMRNVKENIFEAKRPS